MGDEINAETGVAAGGEGAAFDPNGAGAESGGQDAGGNRGARGDVAQGPWNQDPRFKEFYGEYKDWKTNKPQYEQKMQQYEQQIQDFHEGGRAHAELKQAAMVERDQLWIQAAKRLGVTAAFEREFDRLRNGGTEEPDERPAARSQPPRELTALQERIDAMENDRLKERVTREYTAALTQHAPHYVGNDAAKELIGYEVARLMDGDRDPQTGAPKHTIAEYTKVAVQRVDGVAAARTKAANPQSRADPSLAGGLPQGQDRDKWLEAQKAAALAEMRAARQARGG